MTFFDKIEPSSFSACAPYVMSPDTIAVVVYDGISPFHLSVPGLVFGEDRTSLGVPRHKVMVCAEKKRKIMTTGGFSVEAPYGIDDVSDAATVIVPSWRQPDEDGPSDRVLNALRSAHERGAKIVGLCLGAFVVAETGLLDGKRATTHWNWADLFSRRFPKVKLDPDVLYIDEGDVLTSAGTAAGLDCCLHLLRERFGAEIANRVARRIVISPHRSGGQAQFIEKPVPTDSRDERLTSAMQWAAINLGEEIDVEIMAQKALLSRRTFTRRFNQVTGTTLVAWLVNQRLAAAQRLLETTNLPIEKIAASVGFGSALLMRKHFVKYLRTSPRTYREEFRGNSF